jgi:hypothetical protein
MSPDQIQDIVMGTIAAALDTGDLIGQMPNRGELGESEEMPGQPMEMMPPEQQMGMPPQGMPQ